MGSNPSEYKGDCRPVEYVSFNMIRGVGDQDDAGWPVYSHRVDSSSFMGKLQTKTGMTFDLPTEAQWEFACRAGTTTALNSGKNLTNKYQDSAMDEVGRYYYNQSDGMGGYISGHTKVGSYLPNIWKLYDMHGNVFEWTLDRWMDSMLFTAAATDPVGPNTGLYHVARGGFWNIEAYGCRSACRAYGDPAAYNNDVGFRVACHVSQHMYTISVADGTANVDKAFERETVTITANEPDEGMIFDKWVSDDVEIADNTAVNTTFVMPAKMVTLTATYVQKQQDEDMLYMVVDLSGGPNATKYPVRYTNTPPNLNDDTCRTTELWLRQIPKGTFIMGSPEDEVGHEPGETQHEVTLTQDYYIGVFECTQKQWELVMGTKPSYFYNDTYYETRPVESVSFDDVRGKASQAGWRWPMDGHMVDPTSFLGKLREKIGMMFDLPTEAQWEYACRAGTTTAFNSGKNMTWEPLDASMNEVGRFYNNGGSEYSGNCDSTKGTAKVGSYLPNAWGLYDMHGNVWEMCLDRYRSDYGIDAVLDPVGPTLGSTRVVRGGGWFHQAFSCRSAYRTDLTPSWCLNDQGFRVLCLP